MWEQGLSLTWGSFVITMSWTAAVTLILVGWSMGETGFGDAGLLFAGLAVCLTIVREHMKTRSVVRAVVREDRIRSI